MIFIILYVIGYLVCWVYVARWVADEWSAGDDGVGELLDGMLASVASALWPLIFFAALMRPITRKVQQ